MKSKLFSRFDIKGEDNKKFAEDFTYALNLEEEILSICVKFVGPLLLAELPLERDRILDRVEIDTKLPRVMFSKTMAVIALFLKTLSEPETQDDTPADWAADLQELRLIDPEDKDKQAVFMKMAKSIQSESMSFRDMLTRRRYAAGVLPMLESFGHSVELRAVQEGKYKWGEDIDKYKPSIIGTVPIVSINIGTDVSQNSRFYFQIKEDDIEFLIDELRAAKIEIDLLNQYLKGKDKKAQEV
jgi:hypothetical protein